MHSIVMSMLFRSGSMYDRLFNVISPTYEHGKNLGIYVFFYKLIVSLLEKVIGRKDKKYSLIAGALAGRVIFGDKSPVNH